MSGNKTSPNKAPHGDKPFKQVRFGSIGDDVKALHNALDSLGYKIDAAELSAHNFDRTTYAATLKVAEKVANHPELLKKPEVAFVMKVTFNKSPKDYAVEANTHTVSVKAPAHPHVKKPDEPHVDAPKLPEHVMHKAMAVMKPKAPAPHVETVAASTSETKIGGVDALHSSKSAYVAHVNSIFNKLSKHEIPVSTKLLWVNYIINNGSADELVLSSPVAGDTKVHSGFGHRKRPHKDASANHQGVDMSCIHSQKGEDAIVAAAPGIVLYSGWMTNYGNTVIIGHNGAFTQYAHMKKKDMPEVGDEVVRGETIGKMGSTGNAHGHKHLHFEMHDANGKAVTPVIGGIAAKKGALIVGANNQPVIEQTPAITDEFAQLIDRDALPDYPVKTVSPAKAKQPIGTVSGTVENGQQQKLGGATLYVPIKR